MRSLMFYLLALLAGGSVGYLSWNISTSWVLVSSLLLFVYLLSPIRVYLFLFVFSYYFVGFRGLVDSIAFFYHSYVLAITLFLLIVLLNTLVYVLIWSKDFFKRIYLLAIVIIILSFPPIGFVSAGNPLIGAGIIFPGFGLLGFVLYIVFVIVISSLIVFINYKKTFVIILSLAALFHIYYWQPRTVHNSMFQTTSNHIYYSPRRIKINTKRTIARDLTQKSNEFIHNKILFYENVIGKFTKDDLYMWNALDSDKSIYIGAHIYHTKQLYDNVLLKINHDDYSILYKQRIPFPLSMWKPFLNKGAKLNLLSNPIIIDDKERLGIFICYEQTLIFPYLQTMLYSPTALIGASNLWWSRDDSFYNYQIIMMKTMSELMGVPLYYSYNDSKTPNLNPKCN